MRISFDGTRYFVLGRAGWGPLDPAELPKGIANLNAGELYDTETGKRSRYQNGQWIEVETQESTATPDVLVSGGPQPQPSASPSSAPQYFDAKFSQLPNATGAAYVMDSSGQLKPYSGMNIAKGGVMPAANQTALNESDLYGQYLNQFNIPTFGASPFQKWQVRQAGPTLGAYVMQSQQNPDTTLADYLGQTGIMGARQQLPGAYNALMANTDPGAADWAKQSLGELWNDVMGRVASAKYGPFFGPQLAQAMPQMQRQFEATPEGFEAPGESSFLGYLRQRYGI